MYLIVNFFFFSSVASAISELDKKLRREYDTALEVFPQLVRKETKITDFLRTVDYDVPKAAARLVTYWKLRKAMFKERWLLPMTQVRISTSHHPVVIVSR